MFHWHLCWCYWEILSHGVGLKKRVFFWKMHFEYVNFLDFFLEIGNVTESMVEVYRKWAGPLAWLLQLSILKGILSICCIIKSTVTLCQMLEHWSKVINELSVTIKINLVFFIFSTRELSVNRKDLEASTLVRQNRKNPLLDPIAL